MCHANKIMATGGFEGLECAALVDDNCIINSSRTLYTYNLVRHILLQLPNFYMRHRKVKLLAEGHGARKCGI